jgi:hypothetical protein
MSEIETETKPETKKISLKEKFKNWISTPTGKKQFIIIIVAVLILIAAGVSAYQLTREDKPTVVNNSKTVTPKLGDKAIDNTVVSKYDGLKYESSAANRAQITVVVENHPDARPQYGLSKASIVFEAISEGGITRFLAVFGPQDAERIGPVRSARTYFLDWTEGLDAFFAHCGGNIDALDRIQKESIKDMDQFANSGAYWRDTSRKVASEHTLYTSTAKLYELAKTKGWGTEANFEGYTYKDDPAEAQRPASQTVDLTFSSAQFNVKYIYSPKDNSYARVLGGVAHKDAQTNEQIKVKNISVIEVKRTAGLTRINESGYTMNTVGEGKATFFVDGKKIDGTWKKDSKTAMIKFSDSQGKVVEFSRGNMWIEVIPAGESSSSVTAQ